MARDMHKLIAGIPYARLLGIDCMPIDEQFIFKLPRNDDNLGNPTLPALHGGVMGGFMETSGALHLMMFANTVNIPKVVDFSIDYLSPGRHRDSFASCKLVRQGRKIANISCTMAHAKDEANPIAGINWEKPIAMARMNFLMVD